MATKKAETEKKIVDVAHPNTSAAEASAKPIIVTNRPIMKDPMVVKEGKSTPSDADNDEGHKVVVRTNEAKVEPLSAPPLPDAAKVEPAEEPKLAPAEKTTEVAKPAAPPPATPPAEPASDKPAEPTEEPETKTSDAPSAEQVESKEAAEQAKHEAAIEKLADSKDYYLPINAVEKRRSRRFVSLGILISLILIVAWADVALDAGLINLSANLPHTHFFTLKTNDSSPPVTAAAASTTSPATSQAKSQLLAIQTLLEAFFATNNYYPSGLTPTQLVNQPGVSGSSVSLFTAPTSTKFVYSAQPSNCSTAAKNCQHYLLKAEYLSGRVIDSLHSLN